jgi:hypothetical protein
MVSFGTLLEGEFIGKSAQSCATGSSAKLLISLKFLKTKGNIE